MDYDTSVMIRKFMNEYKHLEDKMSWAHEHWKRFQHPRNIIKIIVYLTYLQYNS